MTAPDCSLKVYGIVEPAYLDPILGGIATTPDPGPLPAACVFVLDVTRRGPSPHSGYGGVVSQWGGGASWLIMEWVGVGYGWAVQTTGSGGGNPVGIGAYAEPAAVAFDAAAATVRLWTRPGGVWTPGPPTPCPPEVHVTQTVNVGATSGTWGVFDGRIRSVEMRTGLDPRAGDVVWRFDAADCPAGAAAWTDPRGRNWTVVGGSVGIVPAVYGMAPFADRAADLDDLEPTALANLAITWGRPDTFTQPAPATCSFDVLDPPGGTLFRDRLHVGDPLEVWAAGDVAVGAPVDVAQDGGYEAAPLGPAGNVVAAVTPARAYVVADPTSSGTRAVQVDTSTPAAYLTDGYLTPTVGTVSTPDPGPLPAAFTIVTRTTGPLPDPTGGALALAPDLVGQFWSDGDVSWNVRRYVPAAAPAAILYGSTSGSWTSPYSSNMGTVGLPDDARYAFAVDLDDGGYWHTRTYTQAAAGAPWTQIADDLSAAPQPATFWDTSLSLVIGGINAYWLWRGRIYYVEMRTGLDPAAGDVIWRFDANDAPGGALSYVDPRGRTWTLTAPNAITPGTPTFAARHVLRIPPAPFTPENPAGWDAIPRLGPNPWTWRVAVRPALNARTDVIGVGFAGPQTLEPVGIVGVRTHTRWGDLAGTWHTVTDDVVASSATADDWLGVSVTSDLATWNLPYGPGNPYAWNGAPGVWADYAATYVDDLELLAPAGGTVRDVLAFSGRITDLTAQIVDDEGTILVEVTAVDQLADLENRYVGEEPWPAEPLADRVGRILTAAGVPQAAQIDPTLAAQIVTWRDVDHAAAGALLAEHAAGVDGVLWSATHATTGPFLWIEDVGTRALVSVLEEVNGIVTIVVSSDRPNGRTVLDGCQIPAEELTWIRDVSDVISRIDATWREQTLDGDGLPAPTDRAVRVSDPDLEAAYGVRRLGLSTQLITEQAARDAAERVLARTRTPQGRIDGLSWDLGRWPPAAGDDMAAALDLLDGTSRIGRGLLVEQADLWPDGGPIGLYLDGGTYTYDGAWTLDLTASPLAGMGLSAQWDDLDLEWAWLEFDPAMEWADLYGVAGPLSEGIP